MKTRSRWMTASGQEKSPAPMMPPKWSLRHLTDGPETEVSENPESQFGDVAVGRLTLQMPPFGLRLFSSAGNASDTVCFHVVEDDLGFDLDRKNAPALGFFCFPLVGHNVGLSRGQISCHTRLRQQAPGGVAAAESQVEIEVVLLDVIHEKGNFRSDGPVEEILEFHDAPVDLGVIQPQRRDHFG